MLRRAGAVMAEAYATTKDFEDYVEGWETEDAGTLERVLERASRDVDRYVGAAWPVESNGMRFGDLGENPKKLTADQIESLTRATCAQAEYRIEKGEDWFVHDQYKSANGPDFATVGKLSRYGPKMRDELKYTGLNRAVGGKLVR
jgi:hypothetical protein